MALPLNTSMGTIFFNLTNDEIVSSQIGLYCVPITTSLTGIISLIFLLYIGLKLKLNKFIKKILSIMAIQILLSSIIITITSIIVIMFNDHSFWICQCIANAMFIPLRAQSIMTTLVSVVRYNMALKADNS